MRSLGYQTSKYNPSLFHHERDGIKVLVHGDDFVAVGERSKILLFKEQLAKRFTIKSKVVGSGAPPVSHSGAALSSCRGATYGCVPGEERTESRILNRVGRWIPSGWEYEADQRHT